MKVLLTGATGTIGAALVPRLIGEGHELWAWVRDEQRARQALGDDVHLLSERAGPDALERAVGEVEAIVNLAGEGVADGRWTKGRKEAIRSSRIDLTRRLVEGIGRAKRPPRTLINASAVGYYGDAGAEKLDERAAAGDDFLASVCRDWEHEALVAQQFGVRVVRLRIGVVLSRQGGALAKMLPAFRAGLGGPLGGGKQHFPWIHLDDLLAIVERVLADEHLEGPINAVAPRSATNRELTRALGRALGRPTFLRVPGPMLRLALGELATTLLASCHAVPRRLLDAGFEFAFSDLDAALEDLLRAGGAVHGGVGR